MSCISITASLPASSTPINTEPINTETFNTAPINTEPINTALINTPPNLTTSIQINTTPITTEPINIPLKFSTETLITQIATPNSTPTKITTQTLDKQIIKSFNISSKLAAQNNIQSSSFNDTKNQHTIDDVLIVSEDVETTPRKPKESSSDVAIQTNKSDHQLYEEIKRLNYENKKQISILNDFQNLDHVDAQTISVQYNKIIHERDQMIDSQQKKIEYYKNQMEVIKNSL